MWGCIVISDTEPFCDNVPSLYANYMWGCITIKLNDTNYTKVPSLYVRVYHVNFIILDMWMSSLIICEGVSWTITRARASRKFPHYTWGCIGAAIFHRTPAAVPSLCVRVYRQGQQAGQTSSGSLTMREGVSSTVCIAYESGRFPHYAWGCIGHLGKAYAWQPVPSLCVRVYHRFAASVSLSWSSLIICEGISTTGESHHTSF